MRNMTQKKEYDLAMKSKAITGLSLRVLVAGYIVYLVWKILTGTLDGSGPIPIWAVWLICIMMTATALGFCYFSWKQYQKALESAEIPAVIQAKRHDSDEIAEEPGDEQA